MTPEQTAEAYAKVKHLDHIAAALALGITVDSVRKYRRHHIDDDTTAKAARPGILVLEIPMAEPSRASSVASVPVMRVSLPAPPWAGGFDRQGVRG